MFNIGSQELLVILLLVFLLFGPRHIPEVARVLGRGLADVQRAMRGVEDNIRRAANEIPRVDDDQAVPPSPRVLPASGAIAREAIPSGADPTPSPNESSSTQGTTPDGDAVDGRPEAEA